jgi:2-polyprenyl-3-methyl-5-hydroxy-6-metoxy-1,4-benzoquinol methylase
MESLVMEKPKFNRIKQRDCSIFDQDYIFLSSLHEFVMKAARVKKYDTILDFGAGNSPYKHLFSYDKYIKADITQNENKTIDIILEKNAPLLSSLKDNSVSCILCMDVLEHSGNENVILKEFHRILEKGGICLISVPFLYREHEMPFDSFRYTSSYLLKVIEENKFHSIDLLKIGDVMYVVYSLWYQSFIKYGEKAKISVWGRICRKIFNLFFLPICNQMLFKKHVTADESVYLSNLVSFKK